MGPSRRLLLVLLSLTSHYASPITKRDLADDRLIPLIHDPDANATPEENFWGLDSNQDEKLSFMEFLMSDTFYIRSRLMKYTAADLNGDGTLDLEEYLQSLDPETRFPGLRQRAGLTEWADEQIVFLEAVKKHLEKKQHKGDGKRKNTTEKETSDEFLVYDSGIEGSKEDLERLRDEVSDEEEEKDDHDIKEDPISNDQVHDEIRLLEKQEIDDEKMASFIQISRSDRIEAIRLADAEFEIEQRKRNPKYDSMKSSNAETFMFFDRNSDAILEANELLVMIQDVFECALLTDINEIIELYDMDADGGLSRTELYDFEKEIPHTQLVDPLFTFTTKPPAERPSMENDLDLDSSEDRVVVFKKYRSDYPDDDEFSIEFDDDY